VNEPRLLDVLHLSDSRGVFSKPYSYAFGEPPFVVRELFWSVSHRGAVRGMHLQVDPAAAAKLVWVSSGAILDALVDVRAGSPSFGAVRTYEMDARTGTALLVPPGFAHGFQALADDTIVNYAQDREFAPDSDAGVNWRSVELTWPLAVTVTSARDDGLPSLAAFAERGSA
jgi:dTDP-4-dehydrorhamnose 3,5-epimerase